MHSYLIRQINSLKQNITTGVQLAFFRQSALADYRVGFDEAVFIILFNCGLNLLIDYLQSLPNPEFNIYGIAGIGMQIFGLLIAAFVLAKLTKDDRVALTFVVIESSISPFFHIVGSITYWLSSSSIAYYAIVIWAMAVMCFIMFLYLNRHMRNTFVAIASYALFAVSPSFFIQSGQLWYPQFQRDPYYAKYENLNQETLFYKQFDYLDAIKRNLLPGRASATDLYFLGFGSYAKENVFKKEILYIQNLMDHDYDTKGRSIALINNPDTMDTTPLATVSNLNRALIDIGQAMNPGEDVLFLYLTSHGSMKPQLSVSFWPLKLNQVTPEGLKQALDNSGIKWRIILVSACYSGGFLEPLENDNTIIMTAAAKDRTSFGCGSRSNFTYFGHAVFVDELAKNFSFISSFEKARTLIAEREKQEKITPSHPQLFIGRNIRPVLARLEKELNHYYDR